VDRAFVEAGIDGGPTTPSIDAFKSASSCPGIKSCCGASTNGQASNFRVGKAGIDSSPVKAPIGALENPSAPSPGINRAWYPGINCKTSNIGVSQAGIGGGPINPTVISLENAKPGACVKGARAQGINGKGFNGFG
jgi:hypothetical protein